MNWRKATANIVLFVTLVNISQPIMAGHFDDARAFGAAKKNSLLPNENTVIPGIQNPDGDNSQITNLYPGKGRDEASSINNILSAGENVKTQTCSAGDHSCSARSFVSQRYGQSKSNNYKDIARSMRSKLNGMNPEDTLGMDNMPSEGGSNVCVETTTTTPTTFETKQCLQTEFRQISYFNKLPTTVGYEYTSPTCIDPEMTLSGDKSVCSKEEYKCPIGSTLNGTTCTEISDEIWDYTGPARCDNLSSSAYTVGHRSSRNTMTFKCQNDKMLLTARGAGSDGGGIVEGDFWGEIDPNVTYNNKPIVPVAGDWSGMQRQGVVTATGECKDGQCSYNFIMGRSGTAWTRGTGFYCKTGTPDYYGISARCKQSNGTYTEATVSCPAGYVPENSPYLDSARGAWVAMCGKMGSLGGRWNVESNFGTHTMPDPRDQGWTCPKGFSSNGSGCVKKFPATWGVTEATPGCLGGDVYSAGQLIKSEPKLADGNQSGGIKTCESELYSCPAGMAMNGKLCEDANRVEYNNNPACVNLGYDEQEGTEAFICTKEELNECSSLPDVCVEEQSSCIYTDEAIGSPTFGQCIASEKTMSCPVPGKTIVSQDCSYKPMCIDGNCFEQEDKCSPIPGVNPTQNTSETCEILREEEIQSCPVVLTYSEPDEDGERHVNGGVINENTCVASNDTSCSMIPYYSVTDENGIVSWPENVEFSCLKSTLNLCEDLQADSSCTKSSSKTLRLSMDGATPVASEEVYSCAREVNTGSDTCTQDFGKMAVAMETGRQMGTYLNQDTFKVFAGENHRCDRRAVSVLGGNIGSKSCCNISAPDPDSNGEVLTSSIEGQFINNAVSYAADYASSYMYDFMMNSDVYYDAATSAWASGIISDNTALSALEGAGTSDAFSKVSFNPGISYAGVGISYVGVGATGAAAGVPGVTTGMFGTTTSTMGLGGGFQLSFSPVGFGIFAAMQLYSMYQAALACDNEDYKTATLSKGKLCYTTKTYCESKDCGLFGCTCTKYRTKKCCFNSKLARIVNEQGRQQIGLDKTDCSGFTAEQLEQLDWGQIDLSEFIADMLEQAQSSMPNVGDIETLNQKIKNTMSGTGLSQQPIDSRGYVHH